MKMVFRRLQVLWDIRRNTTHNPDVYILPGALRVLPRSTSLYCPTPRCQIPRRGREYRPLPMSWEMFLEKTFFPSLFYCSLIGLREDAFDVSYCRTFKAIAIAVRKSGPNEKISGLILSRHIGCGGAVPLKQTPL